MEEVKLDWEKNEQPPTKHRVKRLIESNKNFQCAQLKSLFLIFFRFIAYLLALNQRKKWVLQNERKMPTTTLKAPKARGGLPSGVGSRYTVIL